MTAKPLVNGTGAAYGHRCPNCGAAVANVAQSANFSEFVPMRVPWGERTHGYIHVDKETGERKKQPDAGLSANWQFYGTAGERYLFTDADDKPCRGDDFVHYHTGLWAIDSHGRPTGRRVDFLWLRSDEPSALCGQLGMMI